ncbi:MAG: SDR family NAD(P)-dependent oxidoreductase, partial [Proteobacteria bacterium]|nr:SDR family NAD(P)-dependent oxidoreductase [Pseudomonadota bacterium]
AARARLGAAAHDHATGHATLEAADGTLILALYDIDLRAAPAEPGAWFHDVLWQPVAAASATLTGCWHAIGHGAAALGTASHDEAGTAPIPPCDGVVDLRPLSERSPAACIGATSALVRQISTRTPRPQLLLVSRGASTAPPLRGGPPSAAAVLMGLQPVIDAEHPDLRCRWIDLDPDEAAVPSDLAGPAGRYALRQGHLLTPEVVKAPPLPAGPVRLVPGPDRTFSGLQFQPVTSEPLAAGEVRIAVAAAGLNFKDVLAILGRAGNDALGLECAGTIVAIGDGVKEFRVGDAVIAFGSGALATTVSLPAHRVVHRPLVLDVDAAASLPVACLTAWHGLHDLAGIKPGMRVLVHAGAGGVGSMATAIARGAGARVFATASKGKEQAALLAGADAVGDSRSPAFADAARRWVGADGFDIVLNALGPEIAAASAVLLKKDGVFLEIGNAPAPAGVVRHLAYDLDGPMRADPTWFADRMKKILTLVGDGSLAPPRRTVLPLAQAGEALQALGQGRTIGKLVLRVPVVPTLRPDAAYLVTGGTGGLGRALAGWLKDHGAGHVVLAARHAEPADTAPFETTTLDVTDPAAVAALVARLPKLRGVIHAAGVVSDGTLAQLEPSSIATVLAPKVEGARHLDAATRGHDLDFFALISSSAGSVAAPGQAAYASANAWLDSLAATRRAAGLPATAVAFGPVATGMYANLNAAARTRLERDGFRPIAPRRAASAFARVLADGIAHRLVMDRAAASAGRAPVTEGTARTALLVLPADERRAFLQDDLEQRLVALLAFPAGTRIAPTRALRDLGLDSLLSVSLRNELSAAYALDLHATLLFDHPTLSALAAQLLRLIEPAERPETDRALDDLDEAALAALVERELAATP